MKHCDTSIRFYPQTTATWEMINNWLEKVYGKNGKDRHWKWMGFGEIGTEKFQVVLLRQACDKYICKCESCYECGDLSCDLQDNIDGNSVCDKCLLKDEYSGEE
jgi:hypothetical protein